jgi:3D (Asp-Asp-Asp) domain-containing protein
MRLNASIVARLVVAACLLVGAMAIVDSRSVEAQAQSVPPRPQSLGSFWITYYWFAPESWFTAKKMVAPGLTVAYREDFLYSARGVAMQGTGTGDDGVLLHWRSGAGAWINKDGAETKTSAGGFTNGSPFARPGGCVWWATDTTGVPNLATTDNTRPTFPNDDGTWQNPPLVNPAAYKVVCNKAAVAAGQPDDLNYRGYPDTFGVGVGTSVTPWHSIATDTSVIPKGTTIYIDALKDTPSKGCFSADDTGGAIIGNHIDVLIPPDKSLILPAKGDLTLVPKGVDCPPPVALAPGPLGNLNLSYLILAGEKNAMATKNAIGGLKNQTAREDFLYGTNGVVARSVGVTRKGKTIVALGGGWWVNAFGKKTTQLTDGNWSKGAPVWRDGGWRTKRGRPTYKKRNGSWSAGKGVRYLTYHDRFAYSKKGEFVPWKTVTSSKATAPLGTLLALDTVPTAPCLVVNRLVDTLPAATIQVVVPAGTDPASLPTLSPATVLAATAGSTTGCP